MSFDPHLVEAKLALGMIGPDEMPALACDALEAGLDGPSIRRLAGLMKPSGWESDQILPAFMREACLESISREEASVRVARQLAHRILSENLDPLAFSREFWLLWVRAGYPREIQDVGMLDDGKWVAECMGTSEAEVREDARNVLLALVGIDDPRAHG
jgi:hypothetical protein